MGFLDFIKGQWRLAGALGTLSWLLAIGLGGLLSTVLATAFDLGQPYQSVFYLSAFLTVTPVLVPLAQGGLVWLTGKLPQTRPLTDREVAEADRVHRIERQREKRRVENRVAIHWAITILEMHKQDLAIHGQIRAPEYQGEWPETRAHLAEERRYDGAVRSTERAFAALPELYPEETNSLIDEALEALQKALEEGENSFPSETSRAQQSAERPTSPSWHS